MVFNVRAGCVCSFRIMGVIFIPQRNSQLLGTDTEISALLVKSDAQPDQHESVAAVCFAENFQSSICFRPCSFPDAFCFTCSLALFCSGCLLWSCVGCALPYLSSPKLILRSSSNCIPSNSSPALILDLSLPEDGPVVKENSGFCTLIHSTLSLIFSSRWLGLS